MGEKKDTIFAPAERAGARELKAEIEIVQNNPVMDGLLQSVSGLLAILDEHRQVVAFNDSFLKMLGIENPSEVLGLRLGETLKCIHAEEGPGGCGTSRYCSTCGAALAIVTSLGTDKPVERNCALTSNRGGRISDIALQVKSHPINVDGRRFLLLFIQDITLQEQRAALERTFFHDINNMLGGLLGATELLTSDINTGLDLTGMIRQSSLRLQKEVEIQRCLLESESCSYHRTQQEITAGQIEKELTSFFENHPMKRNKHMEIENPEPGARVKTDFSLLLRVLCNMVTNALEAVDEGETVHVRMVPEDDSLVFCVRNPQVIPEEIRPRIFQRNFSTKAESGRGIGTFSMKLFGEKVLGGQVGFTSSSEEGTVFRFSLPL